MRRKYFGLALAAVAALGPNLTGAGTAWGGDREIAQSIIERLKISRDEGKLKNFNLDMKVDDGVVLFRGSVNSVDQRGVVMAASEGIEGVREVVDELNVETVQLVKPKTAVVAVPETVEPAQSEPAASAPEPAGEEAFDFNSALAGNVETAPITGIVIPKPAVATETEAATSIQAAQTPATDAVASRAQPADQAQPISQEVVPGIVLPTAALDEPIVDPPSQWEPETDEGLVQRVAQALSHAQHQGQLKSFGVDVQAHEGIIELTGRAASSQQRTLIGQLANDVRGARGVRNLVEVPASKRQTAAAMPVSHREPRPAPMPTMVPASPMPMGQNQMAARPMQRHPSANRRGTPAHPAGYGSPRMINGEVVVPGSVVNRPASVPGPAGAPAVQGAPTMGTPVPMAPAAPVGAPRYDSPNLPNYAWPGYAAYPNYAALTYPQQYSPSAFPYIGPFYPYPQVPLGWRKVSLEWDDGWWFLDFTDR